MLVPMLPEAHNAPYRNFTGKAQVVVVSRAVFVRVEKAVTPLVTTKPTAELPSSGLVL